MSSIPAEIRRVLPPDTAQTWETIAPALPAELYLGGGTALAVHLRHRESQDLDFFYHEAAVDLDALETALRSLGPLAAERSPGTLNAVFSKTKLQFLHADEVRPTRPLEATTSVAGLRIAGVGDILAMKLKVLPERGELRDYFDIKKIEQETGRAVEEGLGLFLARYGRERGDVHLGAIVRSLGYLDDVDEDHLLPEEKDVIAEYWRRRTPQIVRSLSRLPSSAGT